MYHKRGIGRVRHDAFPFEVAASFLRPAFANLTVLCIIAEYNCGKRTLIRMDLPGTLRLRSLTLSASDIHFCCDDVDALADSLQEAYVLKERRDFAKHMMKRNWEDRVSTLTGGLFLPSEPACVLSHDADPLQQLVYALIRLGKPVLPTDKDNFFRHGFTLRVRFVELPLRYRIFSYNWIEYRKFPRSDLSQCSCGACVDCLGMHSTPLQIPFDGEDTFPEILY